jgi:hypothetical protein
LSIALGAASFYPEANVTVTVKNNSNNGFPWPPPGLLGIFFGHFSPKKNLGPSKGSDRRRKMPVSPCPPLHSAMAKAGGLNWCLQLSANGTVAPILRGVDLDLDTRIVSLVPGAKEDKLRLVEVFHDNNPEFSSDTQVWDCGIVLARCLDQTSAASGSLVRSDMLPGRTPPSAEAPRGEAPGAAVLDLGSGTGIVGLAAAWLGLASHVFLTEMEPVVPLLRFNAHLNAEGHFAVAGPSEDSSDAELNDANGHSVPSCVHVCALDWREPQSITRKMAAYCNERSSSHAFMSETKELRSRPSLDRVTVFASDCVYSPREVDSFMQVLRNLVEDIRLMPGIRSFELIVAIKLRLYSETNRSAVVKFLGEMGEWLAQSCSGSSHPETATRVWQSADRTLEELRKGNCKDDLAVRCGLSVQGAADASSLEQCDGTQTLVLEDVRWKHRADLFGDLKQNKIEDITIFRVSGAESTQTTAGNERG